MVPKGWVHYRHDGEAWLQAGKKPEATARAHISNIIRKQGELRMAWTFGLSKPVPSDIVPLARPIFLLLSKQSPFEDQVFKWLRRWAMCHWNHHSHQHMQILTMSVWINFHNPPYVIKESFGNILQRHMEY